MHSSMTHAVHCSGCRVEGGCLPRGVSARGGLPQCMLGYTKSNFTNWNKSNKLTPWKTAFNRLALTLPLVHSTWYDEGGTMTWCQLYLGRIIIVWDCHDYFSIKQCETFTHMKIGKNGKTVKRTIKHKKIVEKKSTIPKYYNVQSFGI